RQRRLAAAALADDGGDGRAPLRQRQREGPKGDGLPPVEEPPAEALRDVARLEERRHDVTPDGTRPRRRAAPREARASRSGTGSRRAGSEDGTRSRTEERRATAEGQGCPGRRPCGRGTVGWR